jgi:sortase A
LSFGTVATVSLRKFLRGLGKTFISAGTLILLFVAYQLWGTGIAEAHSQSALKRQFHTATVTSTVPPTTGPPTTLTGATSSTTVAPPPATPVGSAVAIIDIKKIGVDAAVVEGVGVADLQKGPGHYPGSPLPGQIGNAAIAGHRTTYGAPFYRLNELRAGDPILVTTKASPVPWRYVVVSSKSVSPDDVSVLNPTPTAMLTLTTCTPRFSASQRLVVVARLDDTRPAAPPPATVPPTTVETLPGDTTPASAPPPAGAVGSLSGQSTTTAPAVLWGLACAALWLLAWAVSRRWRRWPAYLLAAPVFLICLFFFFQSFARFLPANV